MAIKKTIYLILQNKYIKECS